MSWQCHWNNVEVNTELSTESTLSGLHEISLVFLWFHYASCIILCKYKTCNKLKACDIFDE